MDSKDLMSLISEEISELSLLCGGMTEMESVPSSVLSLAKGKATVLLQRIELLESYQNAQPKNLGGIKLEPHVAPAVSTNVKVAPDAERVVCDERPCMKETPSVSVKEESEMPKTTSQSDNENPVAAATVKEPVEVVKEVEYHPVESLAKEDVKAPVRPTLSSDDTPQEKHETMNNQESKSHTHDYGSVRTVLDANRSAKRVESRFVQSIKKAITLNDRIRYMNELFDGDAALLSSTIETLDGMTSLKEARDYVASNFSWGDDNDAAADFMRLLEDRFS